MSGDKVYQENNRSNIASFVRSSCDNKGTRLPLSIISFSKDNDNLHPTQKPIALLEYLIKTYTNKNETVLDFTMGSGSTGVACKKLGRNFIGMELDENYFRIAQERIENTTAKLF